MEVKKIFVFPFKSLKGIELDECEIDQHGFIHDRIYMLVYKSANGYTSVTQRSDPILSTITQKIEGDKLRLSYPDNGEEVVLELPLNVAEWPADRPTIDSALWDIPFTGLDVGTPEVKEYFHTFLTKFGRKKYTKDDLTVVAPKVYRKVPNTDKLDEQKDVFTSFQDVYPGSLMTTASYEDLQDHVAYLDETASINYDSFRMNVLINTDEAWIEDDWQKVFIGDHLWTVVGPTPRCSMPAVDQALGQTRKNRHPLPSLNRYRILDKDGVPCFGICMINEDNYTVKVGDKVTVAK